jgi:hypothetical protein
MCYSSRKDFGWSNEKDTVRVPEPVREPKPEEHAKPVPQAADPAPRDLTERHRDRSAPAPSDRIPETV